MGKSSASAFRKLLLLQAPILAALVALTVIFTGHFKDRLAGQLADALREPIIAGDIRSAALQMTGPISRDFRGVVWKAEAGGTPFSVPPNLGTPSVLLDRAAVVPVFFDEDGARLAGRLFFYYSRWDFLPVALGIWLLLLAVSIPIARHENARLSREYDLRLQLEIKDSHAALAAQVAHDIRSPLAALEVASQDAAELPDDKRRLIRGAVGRIQDIANSLLERTRANRAAPVALAAPGAAAHALAALIEPLVAEKRLQFRSRAGLRIAWTPEEGAPLILASVEPVEFDRVLSNLINNAVEALEGAGTVTVTLSSREGRALVAVRDDGKGIPPEILARLGRRGETHDKAGGSGLGLHHARACAEAWGGTLDVASEPGRGTTATLSLPLSPARSERWDAVLVDDDPLVRATWKMSAARLGKKFRAFSAPAELMAEVETVDRSTTIFMDSELGGGENGADAALRLHALGFRDIYLATGRPATDFVGLSHLKGVIGKDPPWA